MCFAKFSISLMPPYLLLVIYLLIFSMNVLDCYLCSVGGGVFLVLFYLKLSVCFLPVLHSELLIINAEVKICNIVCHLSVCFLLFSTFTRLILGPYL